MTSQTNFGAPAANTQMIEAMFYAYRAFTREPDVKLARMRLGRAHHRVLYFVGKQEGLTVAELLQTLEITKQSLARVLRQLIDLKLLRQEIGRRDRRQRHLFLSRAGRQLLQELSAIQSKRISGVMRNFADSEQACILKFLQDLAGVDK